MAKVRTLHAGRCGTVYLVGAGPGDPGLLTVRAAALLQAAEVLLYDALAGDEIVAIAPPGCERVYVGKRKGMHAMSQRAIEELAIARALEGKCVVRLKGGDPFVFGRGAEEAQALRRAGIPFEVVPGISSAIAAAAYAGIPVTHRACAAAFTVATGHAKPGSAIDWERLADPSRTLVLLMALGNLASIAERLVAHGLDAGTPVAVVAGATLPTQRTVVGSLETIAGDVAAAGLEAPAVAIVGEVVRLRSEISWFEEDRSGAERSMVPLAM